MALGLPTVDSDYVGRAIPEAGQSKMDIHGIPPTPMAFVDRWGNVTLVKSTVSAVMADRLGRMISVAAYGKGVGGTGYLAQMKDSKRGFIRGSLLTSIKVGEALREGKGQKDRTGPARQGHGRPRPLHRRGGGHGLGERRSVHVPQVHLPDQGHRGAGRIRRAASG